MGPRVTTTDKCEWHTTFYDIFHSSNTTSIVKYSHSDVVQQKNGLLWEWRIIRLKCCPLHVLKSMYCINMRAVCCHSNSRTPASSSCRLERWVHSALSHCLTGQCHQCVAYSLRCSTLLRTRVFFCALLRYLEGRCFNYYRQWREESHSVRGAVQQLDTHTMHCHNPPHPLFCLISLLILESTRQLAQHTLSQSYGCILVFRISICRCPSLHPPGIAPTSIQWISIPQSLSLWLSCWISCKLWLLLWYSLCRMNECCLYPYHCISSFICVPVSIRILPAVNHTTSRSKGTWTRLPMSTETVRSPRQ